MKKGFLAAMLLFVCVSAACAGQSREKINITGKENREVGERTDIQQEQVDLDVLLADFTIPKQDRIPFEPEPDGWGFSVELVNELKQAVYDGRSDDYIREMNDEGLMITPKDFVFEADNGEHIGFAQKELNEIMANGASNCYLYQCDTDGDGSDEIVLIENLKYEYSSSNKVFVLEKLGDKYVYSDYEYLGYYRCVALLEQEGRICLMANYDDYQTGTTKAVGLFAFEHDDESYTMWQQIYVRKENSGYCFYGLYEKEGHPLTESVKAYVDEIGMDLIYTDRIHETFYGNEFECSDLLREARENNEEAKVWNINGIDVDNDGSAEYFERKIVYYGGSELLETKVNWYDGETASFYSTPFPVWEPQQYFLTQMWFKVLDGKTVIFSLYHKNSEDVYLLDARVYEGGETTVLLDRVITLREEVKTAAYWDYEESILTEIEYENPDFSKAFPDNLQEKADRIAKECEEFTAVDYEEAPIPSELILMAEKALFTGDFKDFHDMSAPLEISVEEFGNRYGEYLYDDIEFYDRYIQHVYQYPLEEQKFYLMVVDSGGSARFAEIFIYREEQDGIEYVDSLSSLDMDAEVILYDGTPYVIDNSYNYNTKFEDTVYLEELDAGGFCRGIRIELLPDTFYIEKIYDNEMPYGEEITRYVESIREELMKKSLADNHTEIFFGDEQTSLEQDKLLRLNSVGPDDWNYIEVDYNNDGEREYISRNFWWPSNYTQFYLQHHLYVFTEERIVEQSSPFAKGKGILVQLWFKEIDGNMFTFRLFSLNRYTYCLNVSLVEDTKITQVQSYILVPQRGFYLNRMEFHE